MRHRWFTQMTSQGGVEGQIFCLSMCFLWNNPWSVCSYIMGPAIQWLIEEGWEGPAIFNRFHLKMYIRNRWSPIDISYAFAFKLHILHKFYNILYWVIAYRRCDKPDSVQFMKSWEKHETSFEAGLTGKDNVFDKELFVYLNHNTLTHWSLGDFNLILGR